MRLLELAHVPSVAGGMIKHDRRHVGVLADILTTTYGANAPRVASDRARQWIDAGDEVTASLWTEVGQAIAERPSQRATKPAPVITTKTRPPRVKKGCCGLANSEPFLPRARIIDVAQAFPRQLAPGRRFPSPAEAQMVAWQARRVRPS